MPALESSTYFNHLIGIYFATSDKTESLRSICFREFQKRRFFLWKIEALLEQNNFFTVDVVQKLILFFISAPLKALHHTAITVGEKTLR